MHVFNYLIICIIISFKYFYCLFIYYVYSFLHSFIYCFYISYFLLIFPSLCIFIVVQSYACRSLNIRCRAPPNMSHTCHLFDHFVMTIFFISLNNTLGLHIIITETNPPLNLGSKLRFGGPFSKLFKSAQKSGPGHFHM